MLEISTIPSRLPLFIQFHLSRLLLIIAIIKSPFSRVLRLLWGPFHSTNPLILPRESLRCLWTLVQPLHRVLPVLYVRFALRSALSSINSIANILRLSRRVVHLHYRPPCPLQSSDGLQALLAFHGIDQCRRLDCLSRLKHHHLNLVQFILATHCYPFNPQGRSLQGKSLTMIAIRSSFRHK